MMNMDQTEDVIGSPTCWMRSEEKWKGSGRKRRRGHLLFQMPGSLLAITSLLHFLAPVDSREIPTFHLSNLDTGPPYNHHNIHHKLIQRPIILNKKYGKKLLACEPYQVCNKVDTYSSPWVERQCECSNGEKCSNSLSAFDGHTIVDRTKQFKICESVTRLLICRYFHDITWTVTSHHDNTTSRQVFCRCPKNSVAYIMKSQIFQSKSGIGYKYHFACSPESKMGCRRKEPCRLFTVKKRLDVEEVNTNSLCQCPLGYGCPTHHREASVITGTTYPLDHIKTYSGYCFKQKATMKPIKNPQSLIRG